MIKYKTPLHEIKVNDPRLAITQKIKFHVTTPGDLVKLVTFKCLYSPLSMEELNYFWQCQFAHYENFKILMGLNCENGKIEAAPHQLLIFSHSV